jgi:hypothetical protein
MAVAERSRRRSWSPSHASGESAVETGRLENFPEFLSSLTVAVAWAGLPPYGLNNIRSLVARFDVLPTVIGTRPDTSYDAIGKVAGLPIHWVEPADRSLRWDRFASAAPAVLIVSGWATPAFNELGRQVRAQGGAVILMIDNRRRGDLRQRLAPIVFNTKYRNWFQAAIVPGKSARRFVRSLGMPETAIHDGLYGGNPNVFVPGPPLEDRPRRFTFVGRYIRRTAPSPQGCSRTCGSMETCSATTSWLGTACRRGGVASRRLGPPAGRVHPPFSAVARAVGYLPREPLSCVAKP